MEIKVAYPLAHNQACDPRDECISGALPAIGFVEVAMRVTAKMTVGELRERFAPELPPHHYVLAMTFEGKRLDDAATLDSYRIDHDALVHADVRRDAFDIPTHGPPIFDNDE